MGGAWRGDASGPDCAEAGYNPKAAAVGIGHGDASGRRAAVVRGFLRCEPAGAWPAGSRIGGTGMPLVTCTSGINTCALAPGDHACIQMGQSRIGTAEPTLHHILRNLSMRLDASYDVVGNCRHPRLLR